MPARAFRPYAHDPVARRARIDTERADDPIRKLYRSQTWKWTRKQVLVRDPFCRKCLTAFSSIADHKIGARQYIKQHGGDQALFFDISNLQGLCKPCHDGKTAGEVGFAGAGQP